MRTVLIAFLFAPLGSAAGPEFDKAWSDPEIEQRIQTGIRAHRMGFGTLRFVSGEGKPLSRVCQYTNHAEVARAPLIISR